MSDGQPPYEGAALARGPVRTWFARNFFKRRLVLAVEVPSGRANGLDESGEYSLVSYAGGTQDAVPPDYRSALVTELGAERVAARLSDSRLTVLFAYRRSDGEVGGYVWALLPDSKAAWHDSVVVRPGSALLFNGYVLPTHRRRHLFTHLMIAAQDHCLTGLGCSRVVGVVEASNLASLRTLKSLGYRRIGINYLLKVVRRNVVSVFVWSDGSPTEAHVVALTPKGMTL